MSNRVAIIGTGSIGIDLMYKVLKSKQLDLRYVVGRRNESPGMREAMKQNITVSSNGIDFLEENIDGFDIVFDATSANSHISNDKIFARNNKFAIDLTPAKIGDLCVPVINMETLVNNRNINLITCGGQACLPLAYAIKRSCEEVEYIEVISSISSDSAGLATRENLDEYVTTTEFALKEFTNAKLSKAILNINPATPQVCMQTTLYAKCSGIKKEALKLEIHDVVKRVRNYVPGYNLILEPIIDENQIVTFIIIGYINVLPTIFVKVMDKRTMTISIVK